MSLSCGVSIVNAPTIPCESSFYIIQENSIKAIANPSIINSFGLLGDLIGKDDIEDLIRNKYPEMADLLICMVKKESTYCQNMRGDNGLAYGCYQIHLDEHDITEWCVWDFECSLDFTAQKINEGKGYLWTSYRKCL